MLLLKNKIADSAYAELQAKGGRNSPFATPLKVMIRERGAEVPMRVRRCKVHVETERATDRAVTNGATHNKLV